MVAVWYRPLSRQRGRPPHQPTSDDVCPLLSERFFATATLADSTGIGTRPLVSQTEQPVVIPDEDKQTETTLLRLY